MAYSDKLNGYWEEGYHFYFEIRDDKLTVREYRRKITLETTIEYDAASLEAGRRTEIKLADNVLSYGGSNNPMSWFEEFYFEDGFIKLVEGYSFMDRKDPYTMKKVDHGPFDHIIIRDEEFLDKLQGVWLKWSSSGDYCKGKRSELYIKGNEFQWEFCGGKFHVISYDRPYDRDEVMLVPWDLTEDSFSGCTSFKVLPDMLTTHEMIFDVNTPLSVFAREENIDKIDVPEGAKTGYSSTMTPGPGVMPGNANGMPGIGLADNPFADLMGMKKVQEKSIKEGLNDPVTNDEKDQEPPEFIPVQKEGDDPRRLAKPYKCVSCGETFTDHLPKFCPNCGGRL